MYRCKIKIKCCVRNSIGNYAFRILIYDCNKNLVEEIHTHQNECQVVLKEGVYKLVIMTNCPLKPNIYCGPILVSRKLSKCYCFGFDDIRYPRHKRITVLLTDSNYHNLSIEKGEITLWKKPI